MLFRSSVPLSLCLSVPLSLCLSLPLFWHNNPVLAKMSNQRTFLLQLHSNPWNCDCHLKNFRDWVVYRGLYTYPTSCAEPERLADKLWQDVDPKDFACKPDIRVPQSVVFSQPGANVTLSCFIIGNPMPDAKWVLKVSLSWQIRQRCPL